MIYFYEGNIRRITYTDQPAAGGLHAIGYDRQTRQETELRISAFDDGSPIGSNGLIQVSRDGNLILLGVDDPRAAPFDSNRDPEVFLFELSRLFADGFESGDTAAWSLSVP